jgi:hypothetical protein
MYLDTVLPSAVPFSQFTVTGDKALAGELSSLKIAPGAPLPDFVYVAHEGKTLVFVLWGVNHRQGEMTSADYQTASTGWTLRLFND